MGLVERAKNICLNPKNEWTVIAGETTATGALITGYVLPLVAVSAIAGLIGGSLVGHSVPFLGTYRVPIVSGISLAIFRLVMAVVGVFILSFVINALAPTFGGTKSPPQALKVAAYSYTPAWVAGVFTVLPMLGLLALLGALYGLYLLYLGLPRLMKCPEDKAIGYTAVVVLCAIVISLVVGAVGGLIAGGGLMAGGGSGRSRSDVQFDKDSPMGKLQEFGKNMEETGKKAEAAQKSGNKEEQMKVAMEGLGAVLGGGKRYEPLAIDALKPFVPDTFAGLPKTRSSAEKSGVAGLMVSKAEASYRDGGGKSADLEITDTGGASGLLGFAGWVNLQGEKEDDSGFERTRKEGGRMVHEKASKQGGTNEFTVVLGDRFVVSARGRGVSLEELKGAVGALDVGKLESMKEVGAQPQ
jgi:Yip1 domain